MPSIYESQNIKKTMKNFQFLAITFCIFSCEINLYAMSQKKQSGLTKEEMQQRLTQLYDKDAIADGSWFNKKPAYQSKFLHDAYNNIDAAEFATNEDFAMQSARKKSENCKKNITDLDLSTNKWQRIAGLGSYYFVKNNINQSTPHSKFPHKQILFTIAHHYNTVPQWDDAEKNPDKLNGEIEKWNLKYNAYRANRYSVLDQNINDLHSLLKNRVKSQLIDQVIIKSMQTENRRWIAQSSATVLAVVAASASLYCWANKK